MHRVEWYASSANAPSVNAARRLGMMREGVLRESFPTGARARTWRCGRCSHPSGVRHARHARVPLTRIIKGPLRQRPYGARHGNEDSGRDRREDRRARDGRGGAATGSTEVTKAERPPRRPGPTRRSATRGRLEGPDGGGGGDRGGPGGAAAGAGAVVSPAWHRPSTGSWVGAWLPRAESLMGQLADVLVVERRHPGREGLGNAWAGRRDAAAAFRPGRGADRRRRRAGPPRVRRAGRPAAPWMRETWSAWAGVALGVVGRLAVSSARTSFWGCPPPADRALLRGLRTITRPRRAP
ncbi:hypothetical protein SVIOM342S_07753 [Streptomyces violaceorubidus]